MIQGNYQKAGATTQQSVADYVRAQSNLSGADTPAPVSDVAREVLELQSSVAACRDLAYAYIERTRTVLAAEVPIKESCPQGVAPSMCALSADLVDVRLGIYGISAALRSALDRIVL